MKPFAVAVTFAAVLAPSASPGDAGAAIGGSVVDASTGRPLAGIAVEVARRDGRDARTVVTDKHGSFMFLGLDPDRYVATARIAVTAAVCRIEDVASGQMRRLQIAIGASADATCAPGRSAESLVNPDETADVYIIR